MANTFQLPVIDFSSPDITATAQALRSACIDYGFFYGINHGVDQSLISKVFEQSRKFFSLPVEEKMKFPHTRDTGYSALCAEILDPSSNTKGDLKESFIIAPLHIPNSNKWPSEDILPEWRATMEDYYKELLNVGKRLVSMIALALNLDEDYFFDKVVSFNPLSPRFRILHYPASSSGLSGTSDRVQYGASPHSDYGMVTLLVTDGSPGLQVCRDKFRQPQIWEDVPNLSGAFIANIGNLTERWSNCLFQSTLHRVVPTQSERYSAAFFVEPNTDCLVECLESCCNESSPSKFPPIRVGDYMLEKYRATYEK